MSHPGEDSRLDYLDATRAFALVLGIVFHASLSFLPLFIGWVVMDTSTSAWVGMFCLVSHSFRMEIFFLLAGFFGHTVLQRKGVRAFVHSRVLRLVVPFVVGWFVLRPLLVSAWIMGSVSMRGDFEFWPGILAGFQSLAKLPAELFTGTHLWFLYYLVMITALILAVRGVLLSIGPSHEALGRRADRVIKWLANSRCSLLVLVGATACALWFMNGWGMDTPDRTLRPSLPVIVVYGGFFVLGWMMSRQRDLIPRFSRLSPLRWILAGVGIFVTILLAKVQFDPGHPRYTPARSVFILAYALMMWSLVFLTLGVFRKLFQRTHPFVRYVADSSYWLYLIHLPIVVWLQVAVAEIALHWSLKLAFISLVAILLSLLTYDLFVRSTVIGSILNGRRRERMLPRLVFKTAETPVVQPAKPSADS
jgi:glucan biosynthesis protein C